MELFLFILFLAILGDASRKNKSEYTTVKRDWFHEKYDHRYRVRCPPDR